MEGLLHHRPETPCNRKENGHPSMFYSRILYFKGLTFFYIYLFIYFILGFCWRSSRAFSYYGSIWTLHICLLVVACYFYSLSRSYSRGYPYFPVENRLFDVPKIHIQKSKLVHKLILNSLQLYLLNHQLTPAQILLS